MREEELKPTEFALSETLEHSSPCASIGGWYFQDIISKLNLLKLQLNTKSYTVQVGGQRFCEPWENDCECQSAGLVSNPVHWRVRTWARLRDNVRTAWWKPHLKGKTLPVIDNTSTAEQRACFGCFWGAKSESNAIIIPLANVIYSVSTLSPPVGRALVIRLVTH